MELAFILSAFLLMSTFRSLDGAVVGSTCKTPALAPDQKYFRTGDCGGNGPFQHTMMIGKVHTCKCDDVNCGFICSPDQNGIQYKDARLSNSDTDPRCTGVEGNDKRFPASGPHHCDAGARFLSSWIDLNRKWYLCHCNPIPNCGYICKQKCSELEPGEIRDFDLCKYVGHRKQKTFNGTLHNCTCDPKLDFVYCGYICIPADPCTKPALLPGQKFYRTRSHTCSMGPFFKIKPTISEGGFNCSCYHQDCGYICTPNGIQFRTTTPPWDRSTGSHCAPPTLSYWDRWEENRGCSNGSSYLDYQRQRYCNCYKNCGYICKYDGSISSYPPWQERSTTSEWAETSVTTEDPWNRYTSRSYCQIAVNLYPWQRWIRDPGCNDGSHYYNQSSSESCNCHQRCGYICEYSYGSTNSPYTPWEERFSTIRPWTYWTDEPSRASTISPWDRSTSSHCVPPTLSYWDRWEENRGCSKGSTYWDDQRSHCYCYKNCGYICENHYGSTNSPYPPWEERSSATEEPWNKLSSPTPGWIYTTNHYCPGPPTLRPDQRWEPKPGCYVHSSYKNNFPPESCNCYQRCGYICTALPQPTYYPPWERSSATQGRSRASTTPEWAETSAATREPWNRYTSSSYCQRPNLSPWQRWIQEPGCQEGPCYYNRSTSESCNCYQSCGYICSSDWLSSTTWFPPWSVRTTPTPHDHCTKPTLRPGQKYYKSKSHNCSMGQFFRIKPTISEGGFNCSCYHQDCGYICTPNGIQFRTTTPPWDRSTGSQPHCVPPTLSYWNHWEENRGCSNGTSFWDYRRSRYCSCYKNCGYICEYYGSSSSSYPPWEEKYSTTPARNCREPFLGPGEIFERSNETCWNGYPHQTIKHGRWYNCTCHNDICGYVCSPLYNDELSSPTPGWIYTTNQYCPGPPTLRPDQRWEPSPGCYFRPSYKNEFPPESCTCYQRCGYICTALPQSTYYPPWERSSATQGRSRASTTSEWAETSATTGEPWNRYTSGSYCPRPNLNAWQRWIQEPGCHEGPYYYNRSTSESCNCYQSCGYICSSDWLSSTTWIPPWSVRTTTAPHDDCTKPTLRPGQKYYKSKSHNCSMGQFFQIKPTISEGGFNCSCYHQDCGYICTPNGIQFKTTTPPWDRSTGSHCAPPTLSYWNHWEENRGCSNGSSFWDYRRSRYCSCYNNCGYICEYYGYTSSYSPWEERSSTIRPWTYWSDEPTRASTIPPWDRSTGSYCVPPTLSYWDEWEENRGCSKGSSYSDYRRSLHCNCYNNCGYICEYHYGTPSPYSPWEERTSTTPARHCREPFLGPREIFERSNETCWDGYSHQTIKHGRWYNCTCHNDICGYVCSPLYNDELSSPTPGSRTYWTDEPTSPRTSPRPSTWDPWWYSTSWHPWTYWTDEPTRPSASPRPRTNCTSLLRPKQARLRNGGTETCIPGYYFELTIHGDKFNCTCDHTFEECGYICEPVDNNLGLCSTPTLLPGQTYLASKNCPVGESVRASNSGQGITCNCDRRKCGYVCSPNGVQYTTPDWNGSPYPYGKK